MLISLTAAVLGGLKNGGAYAKQFMAVLLKITLLVIKFQTLYLHIKSPSIHSKGGLQSRVLIYFTFFADRWVYTWEGL